MQNEQSKQVWVSPKLETFSVVENTNKPFNTVEGFYQTGAYTYQYQGPQTSIGG